MVGGGGGGRKVGGREVQLFSSPSLFCPKPFFTRVLLAVGAGRWISVFVELDLQSVEGIHHLVYCEPISDMAMATATAPGLETQTVLYIPFISHSPRLEIAFGSFACFQPHILLFEF